MKKYDYKRAVTDDIKDWIINDSDIPEEGFYDELYDWIYDEIFDEDNITGNGSNYYGTEEFCSECLSGNFDILYEAMYEFGGRNEVNIMINHYEDKDLARYFDCTIRCYVLMDCIYTAIEELITEGKIKRITDQN